MDVELLNAISEMLDKKLAPINEDIANIKEDIVNINEGLEEVRSATNILVDWASRSEVVTKVPLLSKVE